MPALALAKADPGHLKLIPELETYLAGTAVVLALPSDQLAAAEEFEVLLRSSNLKVRLARLTQSLPTNLPNLTLSLPHLPWAEAWLELRVGAGGREWTVARTHRFVIVPRTGYPLAVLEKQDGEWWVQGGSPPSPSDLWKNRGSWVDGQSVPIPGIVPMPSCPVFPAASRQERLPVAKARSPLRQVRLGFDRRVRHLPLRE